MSKKPFSILLLHTLSPAQNRPFWTMAGEAGLPHSICTQVGSTLLPYTLRTHRGRQRLRRHDEPP